MNGDELLKQLAAIRGSATITLSPGPFIANCGIHDAVAAELLVWLYERLGNDATYEDAEEVLLAALWWSIFLVMQPREEEEPQP